MATITEQLNKLVSTKAAIKTAIRGKGVSVADNDTFASYADKIGSIETKTGNFVQPTDYGVYAIRADKSVITQAAFNALSDAEKKKCIGVYVYVAHAMGAKPFCLRKQIVLPSAYVIWSSDTTTAVDTYSTYDGKADTAKINAAFPTEVNAANVCLSCGGYLPSDSELYVLFANRTVIETLITDMGGYSALSTYVSTSGYAWTSTEASGSAYAKQRSLSNASRDATKSNKNGVAIPVYSIEQV